ncbi:MAG: hypothetical protein AAFQ94_02305 [Bacteroidota bacterium]
MKQKIIKWTIRLACTFFIAFLTIVLAVLNPGVLYANKTAVSHYTVYHQKTLNPGLQSHLEEAHKLVRESEIYDPRFKIKVCLNDGSLYPKLMEKLMGRAFGWGGYNLAVYGGEFNYVGGYVEINNHRWDMTQLLVHELTHCHQMNYFGLLNSNPVANHPTWKWEGYAEYVARKGEDQQDLITNMTRYKKSVSEDENAWSVVFPDGTVAPRDYYRYWLMVQYCLDVKGITYPDLIQQQISAEELNEEMESWYVRHYHVEFCIE